MKFANVLWKGSPFHAKVVDPEKIQVIGNIDSATNTMKLVLNQVNTIELDTRNAGPGKIQTAYL